MALPDGREVACHRVAEIPPWSISVSGELSPAVRLRMQTIAAARDASLVKRMSAN
jgi:hypothetical protein